VQGWKSRLAQHASTDDGLEKSYELFLGMKIEALFPRASKEFFKMNREGSTVPSKPKSAMNKTESAFALWLEAMKRNGEIQDWKFEAVTFKLADGCRYTPDFMVVRRNKSTEYNPVVNFAEVKGGFIRDDAMIKFKVAREQFWWAEFEMWQLKRGGWNRIR
jgi:hypothetical protein